MAVVPKPAKEGANPALNHPLVLTATPAELDEKFDSILREYANKRKSLEETLEAAQTVMDAAGKSAQDKATAATKKAASPAAAVTPTPKVEEKPADAGEPQEPAEEMSLF